jgi:hypothetical protein
MAECFVTKRLEMGDSFCKTDCPPRSDEHFAPMHASLGRRVQKYEIWGFNILGSSWILKTRFDPLKITWPRKFCDTSIARHGFPIRMCRRIYVISHLSTCLLTRRTSQVRKILQVQNTWDTEMGINPFLEYRSRSGWSIKMLWPKTRRLEETVAP